MVLFGTLFKKKTELEALAEYLMEPPTHRKVFRRGFVMYAPGMDKFAVVGNSVGELFDELEQAINFAESLDKDSGRG